MTECPKHYNACPNTACPDRDAAQFAKALPVTTTHVPCNSCGRLLQVSPTTELRPCSHPRVVLCGSGAAADQQKGSR